MITIEKNEREVRVTIPREEANADLLCEFAAWLRDEGDEKRQRISEISVKSAMSKESADSMADAVKSRWWSENSERFIPPDSTAK
jgi:hypothetical protein